MHDDNRKWWLWGLGSALLLGATAWLRKGTVIETRLHVLNDQKFVDADPRGLAANAGVTLDVYALASAMQTEESSDAGRLAVGCAIRNAARKQRVSVATKLLSSIKNGKQYPSHGHFGSQEAPGKWAGTSYGPTAKTLQMAADILANRVPDPTHGAVQWDAPETQNAMHKKDPKTYPLDAEGVRTKRIANHAKEIWVPGVPHTRFWTYT